MDLSEKERTALRELVRRKTDPVLSFVPNSVQKAWRECDAHYTMINGANQIGGKTYCICITIAELLRGLHRLNFRKSKFLVLTPSRGQAADPFGKYLVERASCPGPSGEHPMLHPDDIQVVWDRSTAPPAIKYIKHKKTENEVYFFWSAYHAAQNFLEGKQFAWIFIDESAGTKSLVEELMPRTLFARQANPDAGRITWTATETKVNEAHTDFQLKCEDKSLDDYQLFTVTDEVLDNGSIFDRKTVESVYAGSDETQKNIRMRGKEGAGQNVLIYPVLSSFQEHYILKEPYQESDTANICVGFDPGMGHPGALLFGFYDAYKPMRIHVKQFINYSGVTLPEWVEMLRRYLDGRRMSAFVPDKFGAGHRDRGTGQSTLQQMTKLLDAPSLWVDGQMAIRTVKQEHKASIARLGTYLIPSGNRSAPDPLILFDPPTPDNGLGLAYRQLAGYRGRPDLNYKGPQGVVKKNDEAPDCLRLLTSLGYGYKDNGINFRRGFFSPGNYVQGSESSTVVPEPTEQEINDERIRKASAAAAERVKHRRSLKKRAVGRNMF